MFKNVIITREDAITAEGGCIIAAIHYQKQARLRRNSGAHMAHHRAWLRSMAKAQDAAAAELRRGIDQADGTADSYQAPGAARANRAAARLDAELTALGEQLRNP